MPSLLLLSSGVGAIPDFLRDVVPSGTRPLKLAYIPDAARTMGELPFVTEERARINDFGYDVVDLALTGSSPAQVASALEDVDAVYVAGGSTFTLLDALRSSGADAILRDRVAGGMAYIGASAGSVVAGPSIEPVSIMDNPGDAPDLTDYQGLGLIGSVVIPHADGKMPPYPPGIITQTVETYGDRFDLVLLGDAEALRVDGTHQRVIASP